MVDHLDCDWNDRMAALQRSAHMERSQALRRLLLKLFRRQAETEPWAAPSRPTLGDCS